MFKRANKITALLVAAATVMSVVPAMAATKLGTKDGTIDNGVAFKDGKYLYEGYRTDTDDKGIYYNSGSDKDKKLDDATEVDTEFGKYSTNEVAVKDGNDKYIVDLSTGKITDDDTAGDLTTTAQAKLETKLGKTERYGNTDVKSTIKLIDSEDAAYTQYDRFGDVWYEYSATSTGAVTTNVVNTKTTTTGAATYTGYTNQSGTYIDASKNANIYVFNGYKMVKIENLGDTEKASDYDKLNNNANDVTLNSITFIKTLGQDEKYIYRLVQVDVTNAKLVTSPLTNAGPLYYIQKISKAQGDKEKGAYLPKTTDSFLMDQKVATGNGDVNDGWDNIINGSSIDRATYIVDGSVYTTWKSDDHKVKTVRIDLRTSTKLDRYKTDGTKDTSGSASKIDSHVALKNGDKDTDANAWSIDINGNVWAIYDGEIKESTKVGDFKTVYTCDRSLDRIDAYDENNLLAWDNAGDVYTNVSEGKAQATTDAGAIVNPTPANIGWKQEGTAWTFYDATGTKVVNNWVNDKGTWYFIKADGTMATGWQQVGGTWYFLNASGAMLTGWYNDNGTWYYLQSSGAMKTGWLNDSGTWYFLNASGAMLANTTVDGYVLNGSGAWVK